MSCAVEAQVTEVILHGALRTADRICPMHSIVIKKLGMSPERVLVLTEDRSTAGDEARTVPDKELYFLQCWIPGRVRTRIHSFIDVWVMRRFTFSNKKVAHRRSEIYIGNGKTGCGRTLKPSRARHDMY
jgi:hypothetical protein